MGQKTFTVSLDDLKVDPPRTFSVTLDDLAPPRQAEAPTRQAAPSVLAPASLPAPVVPPPVSRPDLRWTDPVIATTVPPNPPPLSMLSTAVPETPPRIGRQPDYEPPPVAPTIEKPKASRGFKALVADLGIAATKGVVGLPQAAQGLVDAAQAVGPLRASKDRVSFSEAGRATGLDLEQVQRTLESYYSEQQQYANRTVQEADGFIDTAIKAIQNPSVVLTSTVESLPSMVGGAGVARLLIARGMPALVAAALGEGVVAAGQTADGIREASEGGKLTPTQAALAIGSGGATAGLAGFGARMAKALGIVDVDTLLAAGLKSAPTRRQLAQAVVLGGVQEGFLEELPQSVQEQIATNHATGKPLMDGVDQAAVLGALAGALMGAGGQTASAALRPATRREPAPTPMPQPAAATVAAPPVGEAASVAPQTETITLDDLAEPAPEPPSRRDVLAERVRAARAQGREDVLAFQQLTDLGMPADLERRSATKPPPDDGTMPDVPKRRSTDELPAPVAETERTEIEPASTLALRVEGSGDLQAVASFEEAGRRVDQLRDALEEEGAGGNSNFPQTEVVDTATGQVVARVSYNGRVWDMDGKEIERTDGRGYGKASAITTQPTERTQKPVSEMSDEELAALVIANVEGKADGTDRSGVLRAAGERAVAGDDRAAAADVSAAVEPAASTEPGPAITYNPRFESVEIKFASKPDEAVRAKLKQAGYRWAKTTGTWYRKVKMAPDQAVKSAQAVLGIIEKETPKTTPETPKRPETYRDAYRTFIDRGGVIAGEKEPDRSEHGLTYQEAARIRQDIIADRGAKGEKAAGYSPAPRRPTTPQVEAPAGSTPLGLTPDTSRDTETLKQVFETQAKREALDDQKAANAAKRAELIAKLKKDLGSQITANIDPTHVQTMIGIVRTYISDGVVEARKAALALQEDWRALTGDTFPAKLRAYFVEAWNLLTGETVDEQTVFTKETADEDSLLAGREAGEADPNGQGGGRPSATGGDEGAGPDAGGDATERGEGTSERGPVSGKPNGVRGGRPVRAATVAETQAEEPALSSGHYRITENDPIGTGTPRERINRNLAAIRIVKALEAEGRRATSEEQAALVQYVGWGGLSKVFEYWNQREDQQMWRDAHEELQKLLTPEEYALARNSTQNAHYTSPTVIRAMWAAVERLGVKRSSVLEPSAGIGHFLGLTPERYRDMPWATVEKDGISAAITKALYPDAYNQHRGFEDATLPDNHFGLAISNVPFGLIPITDPTIAAPPFVKSRIHNYFFAKALDKVAPGGLVAFVTTRGTLDSRDNQKVREYLAERADFVGAIRLPHTAFKANAGTEVVTDIIFLRKRHEGEAANHAGPWMESVKVELPNKEGVDVEQYVNEYMLANPRFVLGRHMSTGKMRGADAYNVDPPGDTPSEQLRHWQAHGEEQLAGAVQLLPTGVITMTPPKQDIKAFEQSVAPLGSRPFEFLIHEDRLAQVIDGKAEPLDLSKEDESRIRGLLPIRTALRGLYDLLAQEESTDADVEAAQATLTKAYDKFVKKHGPISREGNWRAFREDPDLALLLSLEDYDSEKDTATKTAVFTQKTRTAARRAQTAATPQAALLTTLGERAAVDLDRVGELLGITPEDAAERLAGEGLIIETPSGWQLPAVYLSGNVRVKLAEAEAATKLDAKYQAAVDRLKAVIPDDVPAFKINARLGASWVPVERVTEFVTEMVNARHGLNWTIGYTAQDARWNIEGAPSEHTSRFETPDVSTKDILLDALNDRRRTIKRTVKDAMGSSRTVVDPQATALVRQKKEDVHKAFADWLFKGDQERKTWAVRVYNDTFNAYVEPRIDGSFLTFMGMSPIWQERIAQHQRDAVARILLLGDTLLAHVVGAGKTLEMTAASMEMKRLGIARKPLHVVPNHLIAQAPSEILQYYPQARVLVATPEDLQKENRKRFTARIASGDWDAVVMPYSSFVRVSMSAEAESAYHRNILDEIEAAIIQEWTRTQNEADSKSRKGGNRDRRTPPTVKNLEKMRDRVQAKLDKLAARPKDEMLDFEQLGVDALFIDEAHSFKNLYFPTRQQAAGIPADNDAQRAADLYMKVRYVNKLTNYRTVVLATGTPVSNSMAEIFVMQKLLQEQALERAGIASFDAWLAQFGHIVAETELDPSGTGMSARPRLKNFRNLPDLAMMFRQIADVKMIDDLPWLKTRRPKLLNDKVTVVEVPMTPGQLVLLMDLKRRAENLSPKDRKSDNMPKITTDGRLGMMDLRLLDRRTDDEPGNKVSVVAQKAGDIYTRFKGVKGTQLIFLDSGTPGSEARSAQPRNDRDAQGNKIKRPPTERERNRGFELYEDLRKKLVKAGVPKHQIAFIHDIDAVPEKKRDGARKALFAKVNSGEIRILIGSTSKMGTGMNVQERLVALHNMDPAWKPSDIEQRIGRILRQGNKLAKDDPDFRVEILNYVARGRGQQFGFDAYMWQLNEAKAQIIARFFQGNLQQRDLALDLEQTVLTASEMKAIATGNPLVLEYAKVQGERQRLEMVYEGWAESRREAEYEIENKRKSLKWYAEQTAKAKATMEAVTPLVENAEDRTAEVDGETITAHGNIGKAIVEAAQKVTRPSEDTPGTWAGHLSDKDIGTYRGLRLVLGPWSRKTGDYSPALRLRHPSAKTSNYGATEDRGYAAIELALLTPDPKGPGGQNWRHPVGLMTAVNNHLETMSFNAQSGAFERSLQDDIRRYEAILDAPFENQADLDTARAKEEEIAKALGVNTGQEDVQEIDTDEEGAAGGEEGQAASKTLNTLQDIEDKAKARIKDKLKQVTSGLDPTIMADMAVVGAVKIAKGVVKFADWSAVMVREFGDDIKPILRDLYDLSRRKAETELDPRPVSVPSGRDVPPSRPIPGKRILEFPSLQKMPEAIRGDLQALLEEYQGFQEQRRYVQPWARTEELAKDVWLPLETLKPGTVTNAEETKQYQNVIATAFAERADLLAKMKAGNATDWDKLRVVHLTNVATVAVMSYRGAKTELGRALNILKQEARILHLQESRFIDVALARTGSDLDAIVQASVEAAGDPLKHLQYLRKRAKGDWFDKAVAIYYASLLSGIKTQERNLIGNIFNSGANFVVPLGAAPIDAVRSWRTGGPRTVYASEMEESFKGAVVGARIGVKNAAFTFWQGFRPEEVARAGEGLFDAPIYELPGGLKNPLNLYRRGLEAVDEFFYTVAKHQELYAAAYAIARSEGARGKRIPARMAELLTATEGKDGKIAEALFTQAHEFGQRATFKEKPGAFISTALLLKAPHQPKTVRAAMTILVPFMRIAGAITRQGFEWTPAGWIMREHKKGGRAGAQADGRVLIGSMMLLPFAALAWTGGMTGGPPDDPGEREEFYALGKQPYSVLIPWFDGHSYWVRYNLFQPFSVPMAAMASAVEVWNQSDKDEGAAQAAFTAALTGGLGSVFDQSFMSGIHPFVQALYDKDLASGYLERVVQGMVPFSGLLRNVSQAMDPHFRRPEGVAESIQAITPGRSDDLLPRRTRFGEPAARPGGWVRRGFLVPEVSRAASDNLTLTLARLKVRPVPSRADFVDKGKDVELTRLEQDTIAEAIGRERKKRLESLISGDAFRELLREEGSETRQVRMIRRELEAATDAVRTRVVNRKRNSLGISLETILPAGTWEAIQREQAQAMRGANARPQ